MRGGLQATLLDQSWVHLTAVTFVDDLLLAALMVQRILAACVGHSNHWKDFNVAAMLLLGFRGEEVCCDMKYCTQIHCMTRRIATEQSSNVQEMT